MFENITAHHIVYSKYLETASTKDIMELRLKALAFYKDAAGYAFAESRFDKFVMDFRPATAAFDRFAFSTVDISVLV
jgi:hypothetical protein